ncbi:hypothetical protein PEBR_28856 [Penicillium brasilianum]|uniref:HNH nuclease domain-containing protein n=1 Tax=Penicillium brasilianum TaxID=104259 RepID=A0A1S9RHE1_PENBI|nr:hypothetical protein PEBR_28856 [Penicillium brasilianum]
MASEIDSKHIFSEFEDPERKALIASIVEQAGGLALVPRTNLFALWFSDISVLRKAADPRERASRKTLTLAAKSLPDLDIAGIWAGTKKPKPFSMPAALAISGLSLPPTIRQAPSLSPQRPHKASRINPEDGLQATQDDALRISPLGTQERSRGRSLARSRLPVPPSSSSSAASSIAPSKRSIDARDQALARDRQQCVLTALLQPTLQVSHILPFKLNKITTVEDTVWPWLEAFWGEERVEAWKNQLLRNPDGSMNTEFTANLMTLSIQVHQYWDSAICAFRPIGVNEERTKLKVAFHWLPLPLDKVRRHQPTLTLSHPYPDLPRGFVQGPREKEELTMMRLYHQVSDEVIPSGYIFDITTPDPVAKPLPSTELLELKWHLSRIASMQGAAEDEDSDSDPDDDLVKVPSRTPSPAKAGNPLRENMPIRSRPQSLSPGKLQQVLSSLETSSLDKNC